MSSYLGCPLLLAVIEERPKQTTVQMIQHRDQEQLVELKGCWELQSKQKWTHTNSDTLLSVMRLIITQNTVFIPVESSAKHSRWTGRREETALSWRDSHLHDRCAAKTKTNRQSKACPIIRFYGLKKIFTLQKSKTIEWFSLDTYRSKFVSKTDPLLLHQNLH